MRIASVNIRTSEYTHHDSNPNQWDIMWHVWGKYYVNGNVNSLYPEVAQDNWTYGMYNQIGDNDNTYTKTTRDTIRIEKPIAFVSTTTHTAAQAYEQVLAYAGASLHRDAVDELIVSDTRNGQGTYTGKGCATGIINSQDDLKPTGAPADWSAWPELKQGTVPTDTDQDGMPDEWETANGLNPNDKTDGKKIADNGYSNVENYINSLVADITAAQNEGGFILSGQQDFTSGISTMHHSPCLIYNKVYDLQGRRISSAEANSSLFTLHSSLKKGLYIVNGKKTIIK